MRLRFAFVLVCAAALAVAGCGDDGGGETSSGGDQTSGPTSIHVLYSRNAEQLPIFVAQEAGLFEARGLDVTMEEAAGAGQIVPAIAGGTGDLGLATATDILLATEQGLDLVFATGTSVNTPDNPRLLVYASQASGVTERADLEGKRVAVPSLGSFSEIGVAILLDRAGVDADAVNWVETPFPQMNDALDEGVIDAAVAVPPFSSQMAQSGKVEVVDVSELGDSVIIAVLTARSDWAEANAEALREFRAALDEAIDLIEGDPEMAREVTVRYTGLPPEVVERVPFGNYRAEVTVDEVQLWIDILAERELIDPDTSAEAVIVPPPSD